MSQGSLIYILLIFAVFYLLILRPQQQQAKKRSEMMNTMQPGAKVITIGGICGTLVKATDDRIFIEVADGVVIEMLRTAISTVIPEADATAAEEEDDDLDDIDLDDIDLDDIDLDDEDIYYEEEEEKATK